MQNFPWNFLVVVLGVAVTFSKGLIVVNDIDPGQCGKSNHASQVLILDRENKEKILICTKNNGVYQWATLGGEDPVGEVFSPGYDCANILDLNPEAKDGLYWIHLGGYYPKQVYCDMSTDGGGYILVGRKNSSVTWTLPSNDFTVEPYGDPHWASNLGDAPILDFRVQIATAEDFNQTKADWSFRMQSERPLKELMMDKQGCAPNEPGIGNIAFVKDIRSDTIVSTGYRCSVFGKFQHPLTGFGWHQMNSCLNKPCKNGFAFWEHPSGIAKLQMDFYGSFSFSASGNHSGVNHDATAFVGCAQNQICCGCFGPPGGTDDYCSPDCSAKNGGTVEKQTYTWFWVRTSLPKRVWNRCMEYKVRQENGEMVSYRLLDGNTTPEKGRCPKDDILLNEGILVVPDSETAKKVPAIPGLLQYRKDKKELFVRANKTWKVIAPEKKILEKTSEIVDPKFKDIERKLSKQNQTILQEVSEVESELKKVDQKLREQKIEVKQKLVNQNQTVNSRLQKIDEKLREQKEVEERLTKENQTIFQEILDIESKLKDINQKFLKQNITMYLMQKRLMDIDKFLNPTPTPRMKSECFGYTTLNNQNRNVKYSANAGLLCDSSISNRWYRFDGDAGDQMSTTCISNGNKCSTHGVGYLNGAHPSVSDGKVTREVCFAYAGNCCYNRRNIEVINCGGRFYIYKLVSTGSCYHRYCGVDV